ncbi:hypothetical protein RJ639_001220 [Escallonia herrerae]|uniref:Bromo domain-containing protein n=1 Tax=Escallonia herrerae TaxID=1293975 RepID=A0AA88XIM8_9ASTE|nr:hypothetical protein RJ639_001220 [Escallonia herrerae]
MDFADHSGAWGGEVDGGDGEVGSGCGGGGGPGFGGVVEEAGNGTTSDPPYAHPLPDKKTLELILDKLQKKDIYGVYAEPVDPEELPDYHEVIKHPMDFATVGNNLANGSYSTLAQLEYWGCSIKLSDVFLICSNAMQYNVPDIVYYKQASSVQELARRKFQKLRIVVERSGKELESEQTTESNSDSATLAKAGDFQNGPIAVKAGGNERPANVNAFIL